MAPAVSRVNGRQSREAAMSDLLGSARELRQKLYRLEVLLDVEKGGRGRAANSVRDPERAAALDRLGASGPLEADGAPRQGRRPPDRLAVPTDARAQGGSARARAS